MPDAPITPGSPTRSANEDTPMDDAPPAAASMTSQPAGEVPYNREFEDSVMRAILDPPTTNDGVESRGPLPAFLLGRDTVPHEELPLPLDDPRRQFKSAIPGIKLTHPTGAYEGGNPESTEDDRAWVREFIRHHNIKSKEDLERVKKQVVEEQLEDLRARMQARKEAVDEREKIERELKALNDQREVELKAQRSIIEKAKAKKEERRAKKTKLAAPVDEARQQMSPPPKPRPKRDFDDDLAFLSEPMRRILGKAEDQRPSEQPVANDQGSATTVTDPLKQNTDGLAEPFDPPKSPKSIYEEQKRRNQANRATWLPGGGLEEPEEEAPPKSLFNDYYKKKKAAETKSFYSQERKLKD